MRALNYVLFDQLISKYVKIIQTIFLTWTQAYTTLYLYNVQTITKSDDCVYIYGHRIYINISNVVVQLTYINIHVYVHMYG